jgi:hypothetical protein
MVVVLGDSKHPGLDVRGSYVLGERAHLLSARFTGVKVIRRMPRPQLLGRSLRFVWGLELESATEHYGIIGPNAPLRRQHRQSPQSSPDQDGTAAGNADSGQIPYPISSELHARTRMENLHIEGRYSLKTFVQRSAEISRHNRPAGCPRTDQSRMTGAAAV